MIKKSDSESVSEFNNILQKYEINTINAWLNFAQSTTYPYVILSNKYPDSTEIYKNTVLNILRKVHWNNEIFENSYFIFNSKTGDAVMFKDSLGDIMPQTENVLDLTDVNGKKFVKEILEKVYTKDSSAVSFTYLKPCLSCPATEEMSKRIYIADWNWVIVVGSYSNKFNETVSLFSNKFENSRINLIGNLFGIMLISFLVGLFMIFKQMNSFLVPLQNLSNYLNRMANEGIRFGDFNINANSQEELKKIALYINTLLRNVGSLIENIHVSADKVSDLSGACTDMLDIVDFDAKMVGQRTVEMSDSSKDTINNVNGMALGIEEIYTNLDGLKKLTSHIAENTTDIKSSISQMSDAMKELDDKSHQMQNSVVSVTQAVNDIGLTSTEESNKMNAINVSINNLSNELGEMATQIGELRKPISQGIRLVNDVVKKFAPEKKDSLKVINNICDTVEGLYNKVVSVNIQFANLQNDQIIPFVQVIEARKKLSNEIFSDTSDLNSFIGNVVDHIVEVNSNSQSINSSVRFVSSDVDEAYCNLKEIVNATDGMNENAKQAIVRMDEFALKLKRVEEAYFAIKHTLVDAKNSMKSLNDLSANLRKVVDDLVRMDKTQITDGNNI